MIPRWLQGNKIAESAATVAWLAGRVVNHDLPRALESDMGRPGSDHGFDPSKASDPLAEGGPAPPLPPRPFSDGGNPVLTARDVTDYGRVDFVADPFLFPGTDRWNLFFEVYNGSRDPPAVIGHATSPEGYDWTYDQVVLNTGIHLAFPYVFEWAGERYMLPDVGADRAETTVYRATEFPGSWEPVATPIGAEQDTNDAVVFRHHDQWWLLAGAADELALNVYWSESLEADDWTPHPSNPVVRDRPRAFRPGGRPVVGDDGPLVFFQDCEETYGHRLREFEVTRLDPKEYTDEETSASPVLEGDGSLVGWNAGRMHHMDARFVDGHWICAVDGNVSTRLDSFTTARHWSIGIYTA